MDYQPNPAVGLYTQSGVLMALFSLAKVLEESGAIEPGRYGRALRSTALQPDADPNRPDYHFLVLLADLLGNDPATLCIEENSQPPAGAN